MRNFRAYDHKNFEFVVNGKVIIITAWSTNTRNGFTHQCNSVDFPEVTKAKVTYRASALAKDGEVDKTKIDEDGRKVVAYAPAGTVEEDAE